jgi:hypothetical protein
MDKRKRPVRRGQYQYQRQMRAQEDAFGALLEWVGRTIERGVMWVWKRVRGR